MAYDRHLHGQLTKITATKAYSSDVLYEQELSYEDASDIAVPRFDGRISQIKSSVQAAGGTVSDDNVYIYDMMGNMTRKLGTGAEAWFSYDENGRVLTQDDATGQLVYSYAPKSYRVESVAGSIGLDASRNASRKNNFVYDASGRVVADSSKNLSIEYDMGSQPVMFTVKDSSGTYASVNVYDPQGWRVGVLGFRDGKPESWRTDIMLDGRKELERHVDLSRSAGSVSAQNATEYKMLYGAGGMLGRENANGAREWYVKNYQGSLVMSVVNDAVGNVIAYEPFGAQKLLQADGDKPAEQYTGKELDESTGLYYYGARFFDPTFAMWLAPDPANQYLNPYGFGGDPVNAVDPDGRWSWKDVGKGALAVAGLGVVVGVGSAVALGAGMTADAMTGGTLSLTMLGLSASPASLTSPVISALSGNSMDDIGNSFFNGLFIDVAGGEFSAARIMTMASYGQRAIYGDDLGDVAGDAFFGGIFVDYIGHSVGFANVKYMGGTADWFDMGSVSDYYQGNVVYSGGFLDVLSQFGVNGGGDHFGHAVLASDRKNKGVVAHELNHMKQTEKSGNRLSYLYHYLDNNGWSPFPNDEYYKNKMEMDSYYKQFLYEAGCIDVYGNEIGEWNHEEMSENFYNGTFDDYGNQLTYGYADKHPEVRKKYGNSWVWYENWWKDY